MIKKTAAKKSAAKKKAVAKKVTAIKHGKQSRPNIPTAEMEELVQEEESNPIKVSYARKHSSKKNPEHYQRSEDNEPQLVWKGKQEEDQERLTLEAVPIYTQEKINPQVIIENLRRQMAKKKAEQTNENINLFKDFNGLPDDGTKTEFYRHQQKWTNRMILGDSLLVMASLAHKEGLKGKVQCIYMDPPYGIKFRSNWQPSTKTTKVKEGEIAHEPEMIQAFRDTWKWGVNSYLSYLRDRLTVSRDLLTESGSIFVQISDENVHSVRCLMDEIFDPENFVSVIVLKTRQASGEEYIHNSCDFLLWYGKNRTQLKFNRIFLEGDNKEYMNQLDSSGKYYYLRAAHSQGESKQSFSIKLNGKSFSCPQDKHWTYTEAGVNNLIMADRLLLSGNTPRLKVYRDDFSLGFMNNIWDAQFSGGKIYTVQTSPKVIQRCILMTTDPGDLVLDPTCGSGVTATVAEEYGRRWITIDTSRVALALTRASLMGYHYPYYLMQDSEAGARKEAQLTGKPPTKQTYTENIQHGFVYKRVPHISLANIANSNEIPIIHQQHQPAVDEARQKLNAAINQQLEEWQVPFEIPEEEADEWSAKAKAAHAKFWQARNARQKEIDESIARNAKNEYLVDQPYTDNKIVRVTGPFTVESLSPHRILPTDSEDETLPRPKSQSKNETDFLQIIFENLKTSGVQNTRKKERLEFTALDIWVNRSGKPSQVIQYEGIYQENGKEKRAAISIGPEYGTVTRSLVVHAAREAADRCDTLIILGFAFEAHADDKLTEIGRLPVIRARMNNDLHMADRLKGKQSSNLFVSFGEPDITVEKTDTGEYQAEIKGIDIFDPTTGEVKSSEVEDIACWMIDTNYDGQSFFVRHIYFTGGGKDPIKNKLKTALKGDIDSEAWQTLYAAKSQPFPAPTTGSIAIKAINHYGDEVLKVFPLP